MILAGSETQHLPRVKLSLFSKHPFGGFYKQKSPTFFAEILAVIVLFVKPRVAGVKR